MPFKDKFNKQEYNRKYREENKGKFKHYQNNKDEHKKAVKKWQENNKEKVREYRRKSDKIRRLKLRFSILKEYNFTCQYCGRKAPEVKLEIDHKYPKSKGGLDKKENYTVACRDCNIGKGDCILNEFADS